MKPNKKARGYSYSDSKMVVRAGVVASLFLEDEADFSNYSSALFHPEFHKKFRDKINSIYNELSDREIKKNLARLTQKVEDKIDAICVAHAGIMVFADIAFKNDDTVLEQMGKGNMKEIKDTHNSFQFNMNRIALVFEREVGKLEAAGCSSDRIDEFQTLCKQLITVHEDQENYKITRNGLTKKRITHLNEIYATMVQLHEVANVIWAHDKEYAKRYDLPKISSGSSEEDIFDDEEVEAEIEEMTHAIEITDEEE